MNGDIRPYQPSPPPSRDPNPQPQGQPNVSDLPPLDPAKLEEPVMNLPTPVDEPPKKKKSKLWKWLLTLLALFLATCVGAFVWYASSLKAVDPNSEEMVSLKIEVGMTPSQIGSLLKEKELIRSELSFAIYTRLNNAQNNLQAGDYRLSQADDLPTIVKQLQKGQLAEFEITFYPGATLFDPTDIEDGKRTDVYTMLRRAGYGGSEIRDALEKDYDHPLLASKPKNATLEGYVYGDTYRFNSGVSVEDILTRTFDEFYRKIEERDLVSKLKKRGMTLHEGVILASIIEREVSGREKDQKQVSQIFHRRLKEGMPLGADATFMYAAQQRNMTPTVNFDSPYNTRIHAGLPPGPISSPHIEALEAAAQPASGSYLYFVSGDDGTTHFAHTLEEHERNTRLYCTDLCYSIE